MKELCQQFVACQSDEKAAELSHQILALLHRRIEQLRGGWNRLSQRGAPPDHT